MRRASLLFSMACLTALGGCSDLSCMPMGAEKAVKKDVLGQLKAPATAKFSDVSTLMMESSGDQRSYTVSGNVDAQNSYGAVIRNRFIGSARCDVRNASYTTANVSLF